MKSVKLVASALLMTGLVFTSCKKDKDNDTGTTPTVNQGNGTMQYNDSTINLNTAVVVDYGIWDTDSNVFNLDVEFLSEGITATADTAYGVGYDVYFEVLTGADGSFQPGTYTLNLSAEASNAFEIASTEFIVNYDPNDFEAGEYHFFTSCELTISGTSPNYTYSFTGTLENSQTVTGTFNGTSIYVDVSEEFELQSNTANNRIASKLTK